MTLFFTPITFLLFYICCRVSAPQRMSVSINSQNSVLKHFFEEKKNGLSLDIIVYFYNTDKKKS